jgi:DNA polymerase-3 subunit epsilon
MLDFEKKRPSQIPIVVLDTETTGLQPGLGHRVVEIGAVRLQNWQVVAKMSQLVQPGRKMDAGASAVNHIYDADLVGQPRFADIADELLALLDGALLVAHNASFDAGFLGMEFFISNHVPPNTRPAPVLPNPWLCTLQLARRHFYFGRNHLGHVARRFGIGTGRAHRALSDVHTTTAVLKRMVHELNEQGLETVGDFLQAQGEPIYTPPPPDLFRLPPAIADALATGHRLRIHYQSKSSQTERIITPHYPAQHRGTTYLIAYCHLRRDQRTFRLDRILSAESLT